MAMKKRVLVTGGAGFLGSHLCDFLIAQGEEVICLDNFFTGSKDNIRHLLSHERFELIRHDIINPIYLEVDEIYSLACPASPVHTSTIPSRQSRRAILGTIHTLASRSASGPRSSGLHLEVYGDPEETPPG